MPTPPPQLPDSGAATIPDGVEAAVAELIVEAVNSVIRPRFGQLLEGQVHTKDGGEVTTVADSEAEELMVAGLAELLAGSAMVGEEDVSAHPDRLARLNAEGWVWTIDPIDGTSNFANGSLDYGTMVALRHSGDDVGSWIWSARSEQLIAAVRTFHGWSINHASTTPGEPCGPLTASYATGSDDHALPRGVAKHWYLPEPWKTAVRANLSSIVSVSVPGAAAVEYQMLATGDIDFVLYGRVRSWDHLPGAILAGANGGVARRLDGERYDPSIDGPGLLVASSPQMWDDVATRLGFDR